MHKQNLLALAALLERKVPVTQFDMAIFVSIRDQELDNPQIVNEQIFNECGTTACALGHAPLIFPVQGDESWGMYCNRVFGLMSGDSDWQFCFGPHWASTDNTPTGAARRIRELVERS